MKSEKLRMRNEKGNTKISNIEYPISNVEVENALVASLPSPCSLKRLSLKWLFLQRLNYLNIRL